MSNEGIFDKVKDFLKGNPDKVDQGLDKAGELLNERTGGKYSDQIAKGDDMVRQQLGVPDDQPGATQPAPGSTPPVTSPDPVPTTAPETVPEAAPDTAQGERP